eukprot:CAMPEP_0202835058 /NCGR_PEP_ID=MMETSP1389-20130828/34967_1 /ASSEMBLY_ACC=CAM_ASM_000865 /TAXON_ID=302021 /ORGANISM="Rhodomonas sp., Strain CCMP768" /LENGTH=181 /DNA_ID=CAMNT_0049510435 /DNA_START=9 /DNA_END=555 /DNA_ORIENTATION=-
MTLLWAGKNLGKGKGPWGGPGGYLETVDFGGRRTMIQVFDGVLALLVFSSLACDRNFLRLIVGEITVKQCVLGIASDYRAAYAKKFGELKTWMDEHNQLAAQNAEQRQREQAEKEDPGRKSPQAEQETLGFHLAVSETRFHKHEALALLLSAVSPGAGLQMPKAPLHSTSPGFNLNTNAPR